MDLRLLRFSDSALLISGHTLSRGLEGAIARRLVGDAEGLVRWTLRWLRTSLGPLEGVLIASTCRGARSGRPADMEEPNGPADAAIFRPSIRQASREEMIR